MADAKISNFNNGSTAQATDRIAAARSPFASTADNIYLTPVQIASYVGSTLAGTNLGLGALGITLDGGGTALTTGIKGDLTIPFNCTVQQWTLLGDQSGSMTLEVWSDTFANYPPSSADSITGSSAPNIAAALTGRSSTLTGWATTLSAGNTLRFAVSSCASITRANLTMVVRKTT